GPARLVRPVARAPGLTAPRTPRVVRDAGAPRGADACRMRPLVPAVLELRCAGAGLLGAGALAAALAVPAAGAGGARAAGLGLAGALAALWLLGGARAAARAARLALPAAGPVAVEPAPRTTARALALA